MLIKVWHCGSPWTKHVAVPGGTWCTVCPQHCPEPLLSRVIQPKDGVNLCDCCSVRLFPTGKRSPPQNYKPISVLNPERKKAFIPKGGERWIQAVFSLSPSTQKSEVIVSLIIPNYFIIVVFKYVWSSVHFAIMPLVPFREVCVLLAEILLCEHATP